MKNTISLLTSVLMISLMTLSCSSNLSAKHLSKPLRQRTLEIDPITLDRFLYCAMICQGGFAGICFSGWKQECDYYDFNNKDVMKELSDAEMVLKARVKP